MTDYDATIEVSNPMAKNVASSALSSLGVDPEDVTVICVDLTTDDGEQTEIDFTADGASAGVITAIMLSAVDYDEYVPTSISVKLRTDAHQPQESAEDGGDESSPRDEEASEIVEDVDGEVAGRQLNPNTNVHAALSAVAAYYTKVTSEGEGEGEGGHVGHDPGVEGVPIAQLERTVDVPLDHDALSRALNRGVNRHGGLDANKGSQPHGGAQNYYKVNSLGAAYLAENGPNDEMDVDVSGVTRDAEAEGENPYKRMRESAQARERESGYSKSSNRIYREEANVDEPQETKADTRWHETLWSLKEWHDAKFYDEWVTAAELYEFTQFDYPSTNAVGTPLSQLFLDHLLVERRKRDGDGEATPFEYHITEAGIEELKRLGQPTGAETEAFG